MRPLHFLWAGMTVLLDQAHDLAIRQSGYLAESAHSLQKLFSKRSLVLVDLKDPLVNGALSNQADGFGGTSLGSVPNGLRAESPSSSVRTSDPTRSARHRAAARLRNHRSGMRGFC